MLFVLSPAKTLDYQTPVPDGLRMRATEPLFSRHSAALIELLRPKSVRDIEQLMNLSTDLASLNVQRYAQWSHRATDHNSRPAAWAFDGDVYDGLDAKTLA